MTELERVIHEAVEKAFKDYMAQQALGKVATISPEILERNAKYQAIWDRVIMKTLERMDREVDESTDKT